MAADLYSDPSTDRRARPSRVVSEGLDAKIVVLGNSGVGKTSLLQRYVQDSFDPAHTTATTSAFFAAKRVYVDNHKVRLQLWDTAGQERFRSMAPIYYRGANAALLLYDITNLTTFEDLHAWLQGMLPTKTISFLIIKNFPSGELKKNCGTDLIIYIVGAKADLSSKRQVTVDRIRLYLRKWFPPPRPPTPPISTDDQYIRPRFTSLTSMTTSHSVPFLSPRARTKSQSPSPPPQLRSISPDPILKRSKTGSSNNPAFRPVPVRRNTTTSIILPSFDNQIPRAHADTASQPRRLKQPYCDGHSDRLIKQAAGSPAQLPGLSEIPRPSRVIEEDAEGEVDEHEWEAQANMRLFEVSAKDDLGVKELFDTLIRTIISKRAIIESEREMRERDSVYLGGGVMTPTWAAVADEEEAKLARTHRWGVCC